MSIDYSYSYTAVCTHTFKWITVSHLFFFVQCVMGESSPFVNLWSMTISFLFWESFVMNVIIMWAIYFENVNVSILEIGTWEKLVLEFSSSCRRKRTTDIISHNTWIPALILSSLVISNCNILEHGGFITLGATIETSSMCAPLNPSLSCTKLVTSLQLLTLDLLVWYRRIYSQS